jgi:hypothetical protein
VAFRCQGGRDRAGQISMLVLALGGVEPEAITADYALSDERLGSLYLSRGDEDEAPRIAAFLRDKSRTATELIIELLTTFDVEATLLDAGLTAADPPRCAGACSRTEARAVRTLDEGYRR